MAALNPSLYPKGQTYRFPVVAPGCPRFGNDTVIDRPSKSPVLPGEGIRPGSHKPRQGRHDVVWWDPYLLDDSPAGKPGIRRHEILEAREDPSADKGKQLNRQWSERREALIENAGRQSLQVTTVTRRAETATADARQEEVEVEVVVVERAEGRPVGKGFGKLVHEVLAAADLASDQNQLRPLAISLGRVFGSSEQEIEAAIEAAGRALEHPLMRRAAAADRNDLCHRETPVICRESGGTLIEGVPDLAFRDAADSPWVVVDFKTDLRPDIGQDNYRRQVAAYMEAIYRATNTPTHGVLLYI